MLLSLALSCYLFSVASIAQCSSLDQGFQDSIASLYRALNINARNLKTNMDNAAAQKLSLAVQSELYESGRGLQLFLELLASFEQSGNDELTGLTKDVIAAYRFTPEHFEKLTQCTGHQSWLSEMLTVLNAFDVYERILGHVHDLKYFSRKVQEMCKQVGEPFKIFLNSMYNTINPGDHQSSRSVSQSSSENEQDDSVFPNVSESQQAFFESIKTSPGLSNKFKKFYEIVFLDDVNADTVPQEMEDIKESTRQRQLEWKASIFDELFPHQSLETRRQRIQDALDVLDPIFAPPTAGPQINIGYDFSFLDAKLPADSVFVFRKPRAQRMQSQADVPAGYLMLDVYLKKLAGPAEEQPSEAISAFMSKLNGSIPFTLAKYFSDNGSDNLLINAAIQQALRMERGLWWFTEQQIELSSTIETISSRQSSINSQEPDTKNIKDAAKLALQNYQTVSVLPFRPGQASPMYWVNHFLGCTVDSTFEACFPYFCAAGASDTELRKDMLTYCHIGLEQHGFSMPVYLPNSGSIKRHLYYTTFLEMKRLEETTEALQKLANVRNPSGDDPSLGFSSVAVQNGTAYEV